MNWYEGLYVGVRIAKDAQKVREQIESGEFPRNVWLILPAANGSDLFDIRPATDLGKEYFREREVSIIGLARSRGEAVSLLPQIAADYLAGAGVSRLKASPE